MQRKRSDDGLTDEEYYGKYGQIYWSLVVFAVGVLGLIWYLRP